MIKLMITIRKKRGISRDEFVHYYRKHHLPNLGRLVSFFKATLRRRNFVLDDDPLIAAIGDGRHVPEAERDFDCITEVLFETREDAERSVRELFKPGVLEAMIEDENHFIEPRSTKFYWVEAAETILKQTVPENERAPG